MSTYPPHAVAGWKRHPNKCRNAGCGRTWISTGVDGILRCPPDCPIQPEQRRIEELKRAVGERAKKREQLLGVDSANRQTVQEVAPLHCVGA